MEFIYYHIDFKNVEEKDIRIELKRLQSEPESTITNLDGSEIPAILETVDQDDDVTKSILGRRLTAGFNSNEEDPLLELNAERFGTDDVDFQLSIITDSLAVPFAGVMSKEDVSEAFQPTPNPVQLRAGDNFGALKEIDLQESDGDVPVGHYRVIDYITLCLRHINFDERSIFVAMNLFEEDTNTTTSHAFFDTFLNALTFETDVDGREDCYTVLTKILDAFGCFITFDNSAFYIIRWDEYDGQTAVTDLRFCEFDFEGTFVGYDTLNVDKVIAHDQDVLYEGHHLSFDNALKRWQFKCESVTHTYKFTQPKEVPCNAGFTRGTVDDDVLPLKTYDPDCWSLFRGWGANGETPNADMKIYVRYDANDDEDGRYLVLTPQASSGGEFNYARSQEIPIDEGDKFNFSFDYSADTDNSDSGPATIGIACVVLYGDDNSVWILGDNISSITDEQDPEWKLTDAELATNFDYYQWFLDDTEDFTVFRNYSIEAPPAPVEGDLFIHFFAANQLGGAIDDFAIRYNNVQFEYIPFINGTYHKIQSQQHKVTGNGKKKIVKEMFISDSPKKLFKGAMKKFDGTNYVLTGTWNYFNDLTVLPGSRLAKHIIFQWMNQFVSTRWVIESDIQGLTDNLPSLINRWKIIHGDQEDKYFRLVSFTGMNLYTCGWHGVFVEVSNGDGNKLYSYDWTFKYII